MKDTYLDLMSGPLGKVAKTLGLPQPVELQRFDSTPESYRRKPVLVLGPGSGAQTIADLLLDNGFEVRRHAVAGESLRAIIAVLDEAATPEGLSETVLAVGGKSLQLDITADGAADAIAEAAGGRVDILVHNAGITRDKLLANMDASRWDSVIAVNIASQARINARLLDEGRFAEGAQVVSLASTSGIAGNRGQTNYATSKAGVIGLTAASARDFAALGGTANAVAPGFIETDMTAAMPALTRQVARRLSSLQQGGLPVDVAETIAFLASASARGINGQTLRVCGQNMVGA